MSLHYLAIHEEPYDGSTIYGIFDTLESARDHLEAEAAKPGSYSSARTAEIQEWDAERHVATHERSYRNPMMWRETWRMTRKEPHE